MYIIDILNKMSPQSTRHMARHNPELWFDICVKHSKCETCPLSSVSCDTYDEINDYKYRIERRRNQDEDKTVRR